MKLIVGSDEKTSFTDFLVNRLTELGHELILAGPLKGETQTWPQVGIAVGEAVAQKRAEQGIVLCWTGTGVSIAANKVPGVRAALCTDAKQADGARRWNDANVLVLSLRLTTTGLAREILEAWFLSPGPEVSDRECLRILSEYERRK